MTRSRVQRLVGSRRLSTSPIRHPTIAEFFRKGSSISTPQDQPTKETVSGWVRSVRVHKKVSFVAINDGSTHSTLQLVLPTEIVKPLVPQGLNTGASVTCTGIRSLARDGKVDLTAEDVELVGDALDFPLQKKDHTNEFLRDHLHLRPRAESFAASLRMRSSCATSLRSFMEDEGFIWISTPILTKNDCEGAGELFKVSTTKANENFFNTDNVYLTVSGQLHSEMFVHGMKKVYTFGPTFRAEDSNTTRHLAEFWMIEPEWAFTNALETADLAERCLRKVSRDMLQKKNEDIEYLNSIEGTSRGSDEEQDEVSSLPAQPFQPQHHSVEEQIERLRVSSDTRRYSSARERHSQRISDFTAGGEVHRLSMCARDYANSLVL